ncbi:MAG: hypothetical protein BWY32_02905 [bacterium ADurb.Bin243]|nr:MAG: hypothetical protein BWY32_02905 [bacterium ADurb.Bin243]
MNKFVQTPGIEVVSVNVVHSKYGKFINIIYIEDGEVCETFYDACV